MTRPASSVLLAFVTFLVLLVLLAPAADAADPDQPTPFTLQVDRHKLLSGQTLTATADAKAVCDWVLQWNGESRTARAKSITAKYIAPAVTEKTKFPLHGICFPVEPRTHRAGRSSSHGGPGKGDPQTIMVRIPRHTRHTVIVWVWPPGSIVSPPTGPGGPGGPGGTGGGTGLPNTGGPSWWLLVGGLGALVVGSVLVRRAAARAA